MNKEKKRKREERQKKFLNTPVCKHCGQSIHPKQRMIAENWTRTQRRTQRHGNLPKAPEGVRGLK
jgi:hypothetical protein